MKLPSGFMAQICIRDSHKAEGAHTGLVAIAGGKEETVAFFEVIVDFLNFAHEKVLLSW